MARFGRFMMFMVGACLVVSLTAARKRSAEPEAGTVKPDTLKQIAASNGSGMVFFDMNSIAGWDVYTDNTVKAKISVAAAKVGKALSIEYAFNNGSWVSVAKQVPVDLSKYTGVRFSYMGDGGRNTFEVKFEDADGSNFGFLVESKSNPKAWTDIDIPFASLKYWWGGDQTLNLNKLKMHFAVSRRDDDEGGEGKLIVGTVQAYGTGNTAVLKDETAKPAVPVVTGPAMPEGIIDNMKGAPAGWQKYADNSVVLNTGAAQGPKGKSLELSYNINTGEWLGVWKQIAGDISKYKGVRFGVRGEGAANTVEFKIECADGANFGKVLPVKSNVGGWSTVEIAFADLAYFWGGNGSKVMSLRDPKVHFAISKREGDDGGIGKFVISQIEMYK
jgi:hypothetical protein